MASIQPIVVAHYAALVLPPAAQLHAFPYDYLKHLPRFIGETGPSNKDHLVAFLYFVDNMNIEHDDIYIALFVQSLEGNVRIWFRQLQVNSINSRVELVNIFKN